MHEMSLCEGIIQVLEETARTQSFCVIHKVYLEIGALAGVELDALRFGFEVVSRGTVAEAACLEVIMVPGRAWCLPCGTEVAVHQRYDACPHCGSHQLQVTAGEEMRIKELEVA